MVTARPQDGPHQDGPHQDGPHKDGPHRLYWSPSSGSLAPMALLEETGTAYEAVRIDTAARAHKAEDYLRHHPLGLVPALDLPDGSCLIESAAIVAYLADLAPDRGLAPPLGTPERARHYQWLTYGAATLYTAYMRRYQTYDYRVRDGDDGLIHALAERHLAERWAVVERALASAGTPFLTGDRPGAADIYLSMLAGWHPDPPAFWTRHPRIRAMRDGVNRLAGVRRAVAVHFPDIDAG